MPDPMNDALPRPLVPASLDLSDLPGMMLDIERLRKSKAWLKAKRRPELGFYMLNLWMRAFHERPAASIENDDDVLADAAGCHPRDWEDVRAEVLHGWVLCADGRLYHPTVAEKALEALARRIGYKFGREESRNRQARHRAETEKKPAPPPLSFVGWLSQEDPAVVPYLTDIEPYLARSLRDEVGPGSGGQGPVTVTMPDVTVTKADVTVTNPDVTVTSQDVTGKMPFKMKLQDEGEGKDEVEDEFIEDTSSLRSDVCAPPQADVAPALSPGDFSEHFPASEPEPYPSPTTPPGASQVPSQPDAALVQAKAMVPDRAQASITPVSDLDEAVNAYNAVATAVGWPVAQLMTPRRRVMLKARLRDAGGLSGWQQAMDRARASPFLRGDTGRDKAHASWTPDLDFFLQQGAFTQLMEGKYDNRGTPDGSANQHPADIAARRLIARMYGGGEVEFPV